MDTRCDSEVVQPDPNRPMSWSCAWVKPGLFDQIFAWPLRWTWQPVQSSLQQVGMCLMATILVSLSCWVSRPQASLGTRLGTLHNRRRAVGQICCLNLLFASVVASQQGFSIWCACTENRIRFTPSTVLNGDLILAFSTPKRSVQKPFERKIKVPCTYGEGKKSSFICRQVTISNLGFVKDLIYTRTAYLYAIANLQLPFLSTVPITQLLFVSDKRKKEGRRREKKKHYKNTL